MSEKRRYIVTLVISTFAETDHEEGTQEFLNDVHDQALENVQIYLGSVDDWTYRKVGTYPMLEEIGKRGHKDAEIPT